MTLEGLIIILGAILGISFFIIIASFLDAMQEKKTRQKGSRNFGFSKNIDMNRKDEDNV